MTQKQLADAIGVSEPSIRLYELDKRTFSEEIIRQIAGALEICPEALHSYDMDSVREVLEMLFRMEDDYGIAPFVSGKTCSLLVKGAAPKAPKMYPAIDAWYDMRQKLERGIITKEEYDVWKVSFAGVEYEVVPI